MDMLEILKNLSLYSIFSLFVIVVGGLGICLFMANLIPGFGMMAEESTNKDVADNLNEKGSETDD